MRYLLDTCVLSDFVRGHPATLVHIRDTPPPEVAVSTITEMEIAYGLRLNPALSRRLKTVIDAFLSAVTLVSYDSAAARATSDIRASLKRRGRPIGAYDALIAGTAVAHDLTLVTSNLREFAQVEKLRLEDWRR